MLKMFIHCNDVGKFPVITNLVIMFHELEVFYYTMRK